MRALAADPKRCESTYEEWVVMVTKGMRDLAARGISTVKVDVDARELLAWCRERQLPIDGAARAQFVAERMRKRGTGT